MWPLSSAVTGWHQATMTESSACARSSSRSDRKRWSQMTATVTTASSSRGWVCELDSCTHDSVDANGLWERPGRRRRFEDSPFLGRLRTWPPGLFLTSNLRPLHAGARDLWHWHYPLTILTSPCVHPSGLFTHPFVCSADLHPFHCSHDLCTSCDWKCMWEREIVRVWLCKKIKYNEAFLDWDCVVFKLLKQNPGHRNLEKYEQFLYIDLDAGELFFQNNESPISKWHAPVE